MKAMRWVRRIGQGLRRRLGSQLGYTLVEVTAVVGVTATLTALALPTALDKLNDGKVARAKGDLQTLVSAVGAFIKDTGRFPLESKFPTTIPQTSAKTCGTTKPTVGLSTGCFQIIVGPGLAPTVQNTTVSGNSVIIAGNPALLSSDQALFDDGKTTLSKLVANFGTIRDQLSDNTPVYSNFAGPYVQELNADPWGKAYFITTEGFNTQFTDVELGTSSTTTEKVWVMTAGPDTLVSTSSKDSKLSGDDLGILIFGGLRKTK